MQVKIKLMYKDKERKKNKKSGPFRQEPPKALRESPRRLPFPLHAKIPGLRVSSHFLRGFRFQ